MKELPKYCPQCMREWTRKQSPFFRHLEFIYCEQCNANADTIIKRCDHNPSLKKKEVKSTKDYGDWDYWGSPSD